VGLLHAEARRAGYILFAPHFAFVYDPGTDPQMRKDSQPQVDVCDDKALSPSREQFSIDLEARVAYSRPDLPTRARTRKVGAMTRMSR
jgi:hypothetical protein